LTGVYDAKGPASQQNGIPRGRLRNGSAVVVLCRREGQEIHNDTGAGSTDWNEILPLSGQDFVEPNGVARKTGPNEPLMVVPNVHLAFFNDTALPECPPHG